MLHIIEMGAFRRDMKRIKKRGENAARLREVLRLLVYAQPLPRKYKDHALTGNWIGRRECHIRPDWLLIYRIDGDTLYLERTGTHSDLFD